MTLLLGTGGNPRWTKTKESREDSRMNWHETAVLEADRSGLQGAERESYIKARYAELEKLGMENL